MTNKMALLYNDDIDYVKKNVTKTNMNDADSQTGRRAIHYAAGYGRVDCLKYLIMLGADINAPCDWQDTPLHDACGSIGIESVKILLDAGAHTDVQNKYGEIPFDKIDIDMVNSDFKFKLLIDYGGARTIEHMCDDEDIPEWVIQFAKDRISCRRVSIIMIGLKGRINTKNNKDAFRHIGKHIWSMRML
jgi:ankyrin repeat protein